MVTSTLLTSPNRNMVRTPFGFERASNLALGLHRQGACE